MASALYTDIKRWKAGIPGSVFCRCVTRPAAVAPRARAPPPRCRTRPSMSNLSKARVVRTDRECDNIATMDLIFAKGFRSFEACFLFPPLVGQSRENAPPVSIVEISIETCGFFFSTDR